MKYILIRNLTYTYIKKNMFNFNIEDIKNNDDLLEFISKFNKKINKKNKKIHKIKKLYKRILKKYSINKKLIDKLIEENKKKDIQIENDMEYIDYLNEYTTDKENKLCSIIVKLNDENLKLINQIK